MKLRSFAFRLVALSSIAAAGPTFLVAESPEDETVRSYDFRTLVRSLPHARTFLKPYGPLLSVSPGSQIQNNEHETLGILQDPQVGESIIFSHSSRASMSMPGHAAPAIHAEAVPGSVSRYLQLMGLIDEADEFSERNVVFAAGILQIKGSAAIHTAVEAFVQRLERLAHTMVQVECLLVPPAVAGEILGDTTDQHTLDDAGFERALAHSQTRLFTANCRSGQRIATGTTDAEMVQTDFEVNQTGVIPVINPVVTVPPQGERLEVYPLVLADGRIFLEIVVGRLGLTVGQMGIGGGLGNLDRPVRRETLFSASLVIANRETVVAGEVGTENGFVVLVRSNVWPAAGTSTDDSFDEVVFADRTPFQRLWPAREWPQLHTHRTFAVNVEESREVPQFSLFLDSIDEEDEARDLLSGIESMMVPVPRELAPKLAEFTRRETAKLAQTARIDLRLARVSRQTFAQLRNQVKDGESLPGDWLKKVERTAGAEVQRFRIVGAAGEVHALRDAELSTFVTDVVQVSGGTGFAIIEVGDPVTQEAGSGMELRVRADLQVDADRAFLQIDGAEATITATRKVVTEYTVVSVASSKPLQELQPVKRTLLLPRQETRRWDIRRTLPLDRWIILHSDVKQGDQAHLLIGRVRAEG